MVRGYLGNWKPRGLVGLLVDVAFEFENGEKIQRADLASHTH
jgi:hypothetical protein